MNSKERRQQDLEKMDDLATRIACGEKITIPSYGEDIPEEFDQRLLAKIRGSLEMQGLDAIIHSSIGRHEFRIPLCDETETHYYLSYFVEYK